MIGGEVERCRDGDDEDDDCVSCNSFASNALVMASTIEASGIELSPSVCGVDS